jgi:hypothetical protein
VLEEPGRDLAAVDRRVPVDGLEVHGLQSGRDSMSSCSSASRTRSGSERRTHVRPAVARPVVGLGHELDVGEQLAVAGVDPAPGRDAVREHVGLRPADGGEQVAEAIVEADLGVLVMRRGLARLRRQLARVCDPLVVPGDEHPAAARRDHLVAVEGEDGEIALRTCRLAAVGRSERLGCVLDESDAAFGAERPDRVVLAALPVEVDRDIARIRGRSRALVKRSGRASRSRSRRRSWGAPTKESGSRRGESQEEQATSFRADSGTTSAGGARRSRSRARARAAPGQPETPLRTRPRAARAARPSTASRRY